MKTRTRLKNYFVIAIALLSLIALVGSAQAAADLKVDKNHPGYVFSNITNVMTAQVNNSGDANAVDFNVSINVTNASGVLYSSKTTGVSVNAGATESVSLGNWMPTKVENITINVTADCDSTIAESDETDNSRIETRNTTGSCADDVNPKYEKIFEKECFGYRGQHPLTTNYTGGSDVIYTVGDYVYQGTEVNFKIGAPGGDVNRIDSYIADIPATANIEQATLYLYHAWRKGQTPKYPAWTLNFTNSTGTYTVAEDLNYTDCKGFGTSYMRERLYGTIVYDVTDYVTGDDSYSANVTGDLYPYEASTSYGYVSGMALMVVYDDGTPMVYRIAHGHDRLATYYNYQSSTSTSSYHVVPDNATTSATLTDANPGGDVTYARLFTATVDGVDYTDGSAGGESLKCNGCAWDVGAWTNDGMGDFNHPIGFGRDDVTGCLSGAGSDETVEMQERDASDNKNGYSVVFALMQACNRTLTSITSCDVSGNEKHSFAQGEKLYAKGCGLAASTNYKIWIQNYPVNEDELIVAGEDPSTTKGDAVTTDGSGCFDATEVWNISATAPITYKQYDIVVDNQDAGTVDTFKSGDPDKDGIDDACVEGFLAPVPEFATIALFGMGLLMLAGYVHLGRRRRHA